jgi:hypothetical protein
MTESGQPNAKWHELAGSNASAVVMPGIMRLLLTISVRLQSKTTVGHRK